jgi:hypothetical protein
MRESIKRVEPVDQHLNLIWTQPVPGDADLETVCDALASLIGRHESLRTRYDVDDAGRPRQEVIGQGTMVVDVHEVGRDGLDEAVTGAAKKFREDRYDLARVPLLRATVLTQDDRPRLMVMGMSHMVTDGWGLGRIRKELSAFLDPRSRGLPATDAVVWQPSDQLRYERTSSAQEQSARALDYLADRFRDFPATMFWRSHERVEQPRYWSGRLDSPSLLAAAAAIYKSHRVTPSSSIFAAFSLVVARLTCHDESRMFVVHSNRNQRNMHSVANYSQTLPVGVDTRNKSFWGVMKDAHRALLNAYRYASYPPDEQLRVRAEAERSRGIRIAEDCVYNPGWALTGPQLEKHVESGSKLDEILSRPSSFSWGEGADRGLVMYLATSPNRLALTADTKFVAPERFETLLRLVEGLLLRGAKEDFDPDEALAHCGEERPGDGWVFVDGCWVSIEATRAMVAQATGAASVELTTVPGTGGGVLLSARMSGDASVNVEETRRRCLEVLPRWRGAMVPHRFSGTGVPARGQ